MLSLPGSRSYQCCYYSGQGATNAVNTWVKELPMLLLLGSRSCQAIITRVTFWVLNLNASRRTFIVCILIYNCITATLRVRTHSSPPLPHLRKLLGLSLERRLGRLGSGRRRPDLVLELTNFTSSEECGKRTPSITQQ